MDGRFKNRRTYDLFCGAPSRRFPGDVRQRAQNKLKFLYAAARLEDLAFPPGNRLEPLRGDRKGQHSIRINDQWRICFRWVDGQAQNIEVTDYH
jgi:proteic killer suppression protein